MNNDNDNGTPGFDEIYSSGYDNGYAAARAEYQRELPSNHVVLEINVNQNPFTVATEVVKVLRDKVTEQTPPDATVHIHKVEIIVNRSHARTTQIHKVEIVKT